MLNCESVMNYLLEDNRDIVKIYPQQVKTIIYEPDFFIEFKPHALSQHIVSVIDSELY